MFSTIVVGTDGSVNAERAVQTAAHLASLVPNATVHVLTASHPLPAAELRAISTELPQEFRPLLHGHVISDSALAGARRILQSAGVGAQYHEADAEPTEGLIGLAEELDADLIVVGSRGAGAVGRLFHGSVSTKVLHHAPCAVLVVRDEGDEGEEG